MSGFPGFGQNNSGNTGGDKPNPFSFGSTRKLETSICGSYVTLPSAASGTTQPGSTTPSIFGQPANSSQLTPSLFGNTSTPQYGTPAPAGSILGGASGTQPAAQIGGGLFGGGGTTNPNPAGASLFGNTSNTTSNNTSTPAASSPFSFGQQNNAQSGTPAAAPAPTQTFNFGGSAPATAPASGSTTPASKPLFGGFGQSTTPAAPPPGNAGGSLFGAKPAGTGTSLFGGSGSGSSTLGAAPPASGGSLFGAKPAENAPAASGGGLFGAKPATTTANTGTTPGSPAPGAGIFGNAAGTTTPAAPPPSSGGLFSFSAKPAEQTAASSDSSRSTPSLFAAAPPAPATSDSSKSVAPAGASAPTTGNLFGGNQFGAKPAEPTADGSKTLNAPAAPSGGFSFGNLGSANAEKPAPTTEAPKTGGFNFSNLGGGAPKPATPAATSEPPIAPADGFSFSNFGGSATPSADMAATPAATGRQKAPTGGFSFGNLGGGTATNAGPSAQAPAQSQNQAPDKDGQSTLFGAKPAKASSSSAAPGIGVFASAPKPASSTPAEPGASSSAAGPSEPAPNLLRGKTLEDIVDGWNKDLDSQVKEFERQAGEVREWDKVLVRNGNQITALHRQVLEAQQNQAAVDQALGYIESQQRQLDSVLTHYEREVKSFTSDSSKPLSAKLPADREREKSYTLAEDINKQLDDLSRNLSQMIDEVNRLSSSSRPHATQQPGTPSAAAAEAASQMPDDPIHQLSAILGAHLRALNSIDGNAGKLEGKVAELEARMGTKEKRNGPPRR